MIPDEPNPRAVVGGNQPPSPIEHLVDLQREAQTTEKRERLEYIVGRADAKKISDRETAGQAGDIIKVAGEFEKIVENDRIALTKPYRDAADAAKGECDQFLEPLRDAIERLRARLKEWSDAEDQRIAEQQAEQDRFFADPVADPPAQPDAKNEPDCQPAAKPAPPPPPPSTLKPAKRRKIVGDLGARVSQIERKHYRVVDVRAVPDFILNSSTVHEAIVQVAKSMAKHMPEIAGIEVTTETDNQVR